MQHLSFVEAFLIIYSLALAVLGGVTLFFTLKWRSGLLLEITFAIFLAVAMMVAALGFIKPAVLPYYGREAATTVLLILFVVMSFYIKKTAPIPTAESFDGRRPRWK